MNWTRFLILITLIPLTTVSCSSARKMREQRKRREAVVQLTGVYCDFVKMEEDTEYEVEFNLRVGQNCLQGSVPQITSFSIDDKNRGVLYCCKRPDASLVVPTDSNKPNNSIESSVK